jgi:putative ABC transport system ATP-binding protein
MDIITLLKEMNQNNNVTVISATHDLKMIDVSDRVLWIRDGKVERAEDRADINIQVGQMDGEQH